jgi:hypothetical protein
MNLLSRSYEGVPATGRERSLFLPFLRTWGSGVSGRKGWRYSPELVERLSGNSYARAKRLTISRVIAA